MGKGEELMGLRHVFECDACGLQIDAEEKSIYHSVYYRIPTKTKWTTVGEEWACSKKCVKVITDRIKELPAEPKCACCLNHKGDK